MHRPALILCSLLLAAPAFADDTVIVATGKEGRGRSRLTGIIVDYTGQELRLRQGARETPVPTEKVIKIETEKEAKHHAADALFDAGEWDKALSLYRAVVNDEKRGWMRRQILAQSVWCYRNLGQFERAGDVFLVLAENDPTTQFFDAIPLCWSSGRPSAVVERQAGKWLAKETFSPSQLLGASWLLATDRAAAQRALDRLTSDDDPRVAQLAAAQLWRVKLVTSKPEDIARWQVAVERLPAPLRAGPYYLLGEGLSRHEKHGEAAAAYLRVALVYPLHRYLVPDALFAAGRELEAHGVPNEAANVYRELTSDYPTAPRAPEAQRRLDAISKTGEK